ncbi:hypothetical protein DRQ11_10025, partial [candidate division KSB1 bacterium]
SVRKEAIKRLGERESKKAVPYLLEMLKDLDEKLLFPEIVEALGIIKDSQAVLPILRMLLECGKLFPSYFYLPLLPSNPLGVNAAIALKRIGEKNKRAKMYSLFFEERFIDVFIDEAIRLVSPQEVFSYLLEILRYDSSKEDIIRLINVFEEMKNRGYKLKIEDLFREETVVTGIKLYFYNIAVINVEYVKDKKIHKEIISLRREGEERKYNIGIEEILMYISYLEGKIPSELKEFKPARRMQIDIPSSKITIWDEEGNKVSIELDYHKLALIRDFLLQSELRLNTSSSLTSSPVKEDKELPTSLFSLGEYVDFIEKLIELLGSSDESHRRWAETTLEISMQNPQFKNYILLKHFKKLIELLLFKKEPIILKSLFKFKDLNEDVHREFVINNISIIEKLIDKMIDLNREEFLAPEEKEIFEGIKSYFLLCAEYIPSKLVTFENFKKLVKEERFSEYLYSFCIKLLRLNPQTINSKILELLFNEAIKEHNPWRVVLLIRLIELRSEIVSSDFVKKMIEETAKTFPELIKGRAEKIVQEGYEIIKEKKEIDSLPESRKKKPTFIFHSSPRYFEELINLLSLLVSLYPEEVKKAKQTKELIKRYSDYIIYKVIIYYRYLDISEIERFKEIISLFPEEENRFKNFLLQYMEDLKTKWLREIKKRFSDEEFIEGFKRLIEILWLGDGERVFTLMKIERLSEILGLFGNGKVFSENEEILNFTKKEREFLEKIIRDVLREVLLSLCDAGDYEDSSSPINSSVRLSQNMLIEKLSFQAVENIEELNSLVSSLSNKYLASSPVKKEKELPILLSSLEKSTNKDRNSSGSLLKDKKELGLAARGSKGNKDRAVPNFREAGAFEKKIRELAFWRGLDEKEVQGILLRLNSLMKIISTALGEDTELRIRPADEWKYDFENNEITFPIELLLEFSPEEIVGIVGHEAGHRQISRLNLNKEVFRLFFSKEYLHSVFNVFEDCRVNNWMLKEFRGLEYYLARAYDKYICEEDHTQSRYVEELQGELKDKENHPYQLYPHLEYNAGVLYYWRYKKLPPQFIHPQVKQALEKTVGYFDEIFNHYPEGRVSEKERFQFAEDAAEFVREHILPEYEKLVKESIRRLSEAIKEGKIEVGLGKGRSPSDLSPQDLDREAQRIIEEKARELADRLEPKIERPDLKKAREAKKRGIKEGSPPLEPLYQPGSLRLRDLIRRNAKIQKKIQRQIDEYGRVYSLIHNLLQELTGLLENYLRKTRKPRYQGYFLSGQRPDLRRAMNLWRKMKLEQPISRRDQKIMYRRILPRKREHRIVLVLDESGSMDEPKRTYALAGLLLFMEALSNLDIDYAIIGFSGVPIIHKDFTRQITPDERKELFEEISYFIPSGMTADSDALNLTIDLLKEEPYNATRLIIMITDGEGNINTTGKTLEELQEEAEQENIKVIGVGLGEGITEVKNHYKNSIQVKDPQELLSALKNILERIISDSGFKSSSPLSNSLIPSDQTNLLSLIYLYLKERYPIINIRHLKRA